MFHHSRRHPHVHIVTWHGDRAVRRVVAGGVLILLGIATLLEGQGLISAHDLWLVAPVAIALSGLARLLASPGMINAARAVLRLAIAAYLVVVIEHIGGWTFAATWPVLLIAGGAGMVAHALFGRRKAKEPNW